MFSRTQIYQMLKMQMEANNQMSTAWLTSTNAEIPYFRAMHMELNECIDWMGFKWWKKFSPNLDPAKMELIDVLHFVLSASLREHFIEKPAHKQTEHMLNNAADSIMGDCENLRVRTFRPDVMGVLKPIEELSEVEVLEDVLREVLTTKGMTFTSLLHLFVRFGMSSRHVFTLYLGKNLLNRFRTAHGQLENTYSKIWWGKEDNDHLIDWLDRNEFEELDSVFIQRADEALTAMYEQAKSEDALSKA